jgi:hypothetical protein
MQLVDRRTYRAKKPKQTKNGYVNDRTLVYLNFFGAIKYSSPNGPLRLTTRESFERWASHDVTEQLPAGCYMTWEQYQNQRMGIV